MLTRRLSFQWLSFDNGEVRRGRGKVPLQGDIWASRNIDISPYASRALNSQRKARGQLCILQKHFSKIDDSF